MDYSELRAANSQLTPQQADYVENTLGPAMEAKLTQLVQAFDKELFGYFFDQSTGKTYSQVLDESGSADEPAYVVTPRVKQYAQDFFGCPSLRGAPMERAEVHWDPHAIWDDIMTGWAEGYIRRVTPFTLKFLEDTGWYIPNYNAAQDPEQGRGAGCKYAMGQGQK